MPYIFCQGTPQRTNCCPTETSAVDQPLRWLTMFKPLLDNPNAVVEEWHNLPNNFHGDKVANFSSLPVDVTWKEISKVNDFSENFKYLSCILCGSGGIFKPSEGFLVIWSGKNFSCIWQQWFTCLLQLQVNCPCFLVYWSNKNVWKWWWDGFWTIQHNYRRLAYTFWLCYVLI